MSKPPAPPVPGPPVTMPPATMPPVTMPPVTMPPVTTPPVTTPPVTTPPVTTAPVTTPPVTAPPVPAPRTKRPPRGILPPPDNSFHPNQPTTPPHPTLKAKSRHPWMTMVHPGPWTQLPPAPSPFTPPWASSLPGHHRGWFKARVAPPNPFAEAHKVANYIAGRKASKQPANQTKRSEPTSQSRKAPSPPKEKSDVAGQPRSRDRSNAVNVASTSSVASPFDGPAPSEKPPCEDPSPPSAQTDSSPGLGGSNQDRPGGSPAATAAGLPEGLGDTPLLAQTVCLASGLGVHVIAPASMDSSNAPGLGSSTQDGLLSGPVEGAHPPGSLTVPEAGATGGGAGTAGGRGRPDFAGTISLRGSASGYTPPAPASSGGLGSFADIGCEVPGVPDLGNALCGLPIDRGADITAQRGLPAPIEVPMGLSGLAIEQGLTEAAGQATLMALSSSPGLAGGPLISGLPGANPLGSSHLPAVGGRLGKPDLTQSDNLGGLSRGVDVASFVGQGRSADIGDSPEVPGVGECPAVGGLMESACAGAFAATPGLSSIPKSFSVPAIFSGLKKGRTTLSLNERPDPRPAVPRSNTMQASLSSRPQAPGYGFPPIKRKVRTDACVPTDDLQGELGEVSARLEELELCGAQLESKLRDCRNKKEEEAMLTDWMALIQEKQTLLRREAEITHLTEQKTLEERQADLEYKLRCLLIKPESEWSAEEEAQEQKMMEDLVAVIEQRNAIISSLDEDRKREKEDDSVLGAMKDQEFQKRGLSELKKSKGKFKPMKVFRMLGAQESKDKKN
ncbi:MICAL-like protein 1 isoform X1 [Gadus morhua]|uniref:MICAL-like protein 1 n=1 Tax=Gadus morhua TaxID=8049 RepID=A0A8C5AYC6_GADMO|nr:MICAL-like protein 1 isoform X1 [Gadus morhua]XP_030237044.1 MICAL-like protein 1 isoform X1 [Gadus morhua]XP_030237051.1 MICAL-like protein 1 isoform X1 [Gadus morhua]